jgi:glycosyl transferase family 25
MKDKIKNYIGAYVINLEENTDRKKTFFEEWNNIDPRIAVVKAVDTRNHLWENYKEHISEKAIEELKKTIKNKKRIRHEDLTEGAVGCYLSHLKCWKRFLKESTSKDYCLIFEDDSSIPKNLIKTTDNIVKRINVEWGVILLGWRANSQYKHFNKDLLIAGDFWFLHSYLLSNFGARKLLELHDKIEIQVDHFVSKHKEKVKVFGTIDNLTTQKNTCGYTNIQTHDA